MTWICYTLDMEKMATKHKKKHAQKFIAPSVKYVNEPIFTKLKLSRQILVQ